ncbi:MAG: hypothetical protein HeimC3_17090 [Candidatus Heimdallarchaeota archaeon LC_3]|nr:MAG: hypothetical protein HeimC3_17090 [Candidatus Heimdallarchaeota archaeon LC_3]
MKEYENFGLLNHIFENYIKKHHIFDKTDLYIEGEMDVEVDIKYRLILSDFPFKYRKLTSSIYIEKLLFFKEILESEGLVILIIPSNLLFSKASENFRTDLQHLFYIEAIASVSIPNYFNFSFVSFSFIILKEAIKQNIINSFILNSQEEIDLFFKNIFNGLVNSSLLRISISKDKIENNILDPNYYQEEYLEIEKELSNYQLKKLGDLAELLRGMRYRREILVEEGEINFIRVRNLQNNKIFGKGA